MPVTEQEGVQIPETASAPSTSLKTQDINAHDGETCGSSVYKKTSSSEKTVLSYSKMDHSSSFCEFVLPQKEYALHIEEAKKPFISSKVLPLDLSDPIYLANKKLSPELINEALKLETQNLNSINFPSSSGRKFNPKAKYVILPNGTYNERKWLVYSISTDAVFCLHCMLFSLPTENSIWSTTGYRGWTDRRGDRDIELHERSKQHRSSQMARLQWISKTRIDENLCELNDKLVLHHREVLSVIIDCCRFLANEMLGFRNTNSLDGKLSNLFRLLAKYNPDARVYLEKLDKSKEEKSKLGSNFLSYRNIFDLITVMNNLVVSKIVERLNETKTYSIILDSTQDISKKECTTVLVRYVEHTNGQVKPEERLVKVFTSGDTTGEHLSSRLLYTLREIGVDPHAMVGQSMDGAGNMKGKFKGVKSLVLKECPKAYYIWCCSHRFALVVEKAMDICPQIRNLFSILQELYVFMSGHKRHSIFTKKLEKGPCNVRRRRLKRVNTTRWSSRSDALSTILTCYDVLREALHDISEDKNSDIESRSSSKGLSKAITSYETIATMHITFKLFKILSPVTVCLQSKNINYGIVPTIVSDTISNLRKLRNDESWEEIKGQISQFIVQHNLPETRSRRTTKRKRFMDELSIDETPNDPAVKIKIEVYFNLIDSLMFQMNDRFPESSLKIVQQMTLFSHERLVNISENKENLISPAQVNELCEHYDINCEALCDEVNVFSQLYKISYPDIDVSDVLSFSDESLGNRDNECYNSDDSIKDKTSKNKVLDQWLEKGFIRPYRCLVNFSSFPYLTMMYRIILSLPATSCSAERVMSRIKIVKNRLRSSMGDVWLSDLLVLCSEKDILKSIPNSEIMEKFALTSEQRRKLLLYKGHQK